MTKAAGRHVGRPLQKIMFDQCVEIGINGGPFSGVMKRTYRLCNQFPTQPNSQLKKYFSLKMFSLHILSTPGIFGLVQANMVHFSGDIKIAVGSG